TRRVEARNRPLDDPLLWLAADAQGLELVNRAGIWARILDVPMALETRRYQADGELVLEVLDESLPEVGGRFRLQVREGTARCVPSRAEPELRLELAQLSGGYLGLPHFAAQARAGRLSELAPGAARRLDQLLGWDPPPWCLDEF
ncbi:MAG: sterol carrier protein domain-containing protein, partial [Candidatus Dormibacteria bacterium]